MTDHEQLRNQYKEWLSNLKVGDMVCLEYHYFSEINRSLSRVSRITPKKWITVQGKPDDLYFKDGETRKIKSSTSIYYKIVPLTPEIEEDIKLTFAKNVIKTTNFDNLPPDMIKKIYQIIHVKESIK